MGLKHLKLIYARRNLVQDAHYFYKKLLCTFVNALCQCKMLPKSFM